MDFLGEGEDGTWLPSLETSRAAFLSPGILDIADYMCIYIKSFEEDILFADRLESDF